MRSLADCATGATDKTDWIRIGRATYDTCLARRDYRRGLPADRVLEP